MGEMTMLDRVAAAMERYYVSLWHEVTGRGVWWLVLDRDKSLDAVFRGHSQEEAREFCRKANARAVVEAMREPTEAIYLARPVHIHDREDWRRIWQGAIDAALTEPGT